MASGGRLAIEKVEVDGEALTIRLGVKHTACLAEDRCLPPNLNKINIFTPLPDFIEKKCCQRKTICEPPNQKF
jgi:hypothetical protein